MQDMKGDMAGGAAVIAAMAAVAELELPVRIVAVVAAAENLVSGDSFGPATSFAQQTARRSRSRTPTPKDGSCSLTRCGTRGAKALRTCSTSRR